MRTSTKPTNPDRKRSRKGVGLIEGAQEAIDRAKNMKIVSHARKANLASTHASDRADDAAIENAPRAFGDTRVRLDAQRATPRGDVADLGHARKDRVLPREDEVRLPLSRYEVKARDTARRTARAQTPRIQRQALDRLIAGDEANWERINQALTTAQGSVLQVEKDDELAARQIRRVDRAIQAQERHNDRTQIVHSNVTVPPDVSGKAHAMRTYLSKHFKPGEVITFDQYTCGARNLHEVSTGHEEKEGMFALEIRTRRGAYLGAGANDPDHTEFILPRGMQAKVVGVTRADYNDPVTKTVRQRVVLQLEDVDLTPKEHR